MLRIEAGELHPLCVREPPGQQQQFAQQRDGTSLGDPFYPQQKP